MGAPATFGFDHFPVGPGLPVVLVYGEAAYRTCLRAATGLHRYSEVALPLLAERADAAFGANFEKLATRAVVIWPEPGPAGVERALIHAEAIAARGALAVGVVPRALAFDLTAPLPDDRAASEIGARVDAVLVEAMARALPQQGARRGRAVVPWLKPLEASAMFANTRAFLARHLAEPQTTLDALVLWCLHAWCVRAKAAQPFDLSPRLVLHANDARADHARALRLVALLTPSPLIVSRAVAAHLVRAIERDAPTLLLDDIAGGLLYRRDMRALIAAGATSDGLFLSATTKRNPTGRSACFAPAAIATTSRLPEDVRVRSIVVAMTPTGARARPSLGAVTAEALALRAQMQAFAAQAVLDLSAADAAVPRRFGSAAREAWLPLIAVALAVSARIAEHAVAAAEAIATADPEPTSNLALLTDIRACFGADGRAHVPTADLILKLGADPELPWGSVKRGRRIDAREVAERLGTFGVKPVSLKNADGQSVRGYRGCDLAEAYARYLDELPAQGRSMVAAE